MIFGVFSELLLGRLPGLTFFSSQTAITQAKLSSESQRKTSTKARARSLTEKLAIECCLGWRCSIRRTIIARKKPVAIHESSFGTVALLSAPS